MWEDVTCRGEGRGALRTPAEALLVPGTVQGASGLEVSAEVCVQGIPRNTASSGKVGPARQTQVLCTAAGPAPGVNSCVLLLW